MHGWALAFLVGCGSATPAPHAVNDEAKPAEPAASTEPEGAAGGTGESAPADSAKETPKEAEPETLSPADLATVLQAVLNDPELDGYLHLEKAGRSPVKLSGPDLPKDLKLVKGKHPVTVVDGPKSEKDPVVVLTRIGLEGTIATVAYRYDVEKIRGTTRIKNGKSGWELMSSRIVGK